MATLHWLAVLRIGLGFVVAREFPAQEQAGLIGVF